MRDIIFRGKRVDNGEWVEGYYAVIIDDYNGEPICYNCLTGDKHWWLFDEIEVTK